MNKERKAFKILQEGKIDVNQHNESEECSGMIIKLKLRIYMITETSARVW